MENPRSSPPPLSTFRLAAFASLGVPIAATLLPLAVYLPPFYAQSMGLGLGAVGGVFMLSRLWNAVCDPLFGILSDRTRTRLGRRKPWILGGLPIFVIAVVAIFWPAKHAGALYLGAWLFVLYVGWAMVGTAFYAWSGELSAQYHQRSRIQTYVQVTVASGYALVLLIPAILDQFKLGSAQAKVGAMGGFALLSLLPGVIALLFFFRESDLPPAKSDKIHFGRSLFQAATNTLVLRVMGSDFFVCFGQAVRSALFVFFVTAYMGLPKWASLLFLLQFIFGIFAGPIWLRVGYRLGKHRTVIAGEIVQVAVNLSLLAISPGALGPLITLTIAQGLAQGSGNLMLRAIVSDVADQLRLRTGAEQSGLLFSIFNVTTNAAGAVAVDLAYPLLAWIGFQPGHANSPAALSGLATLFALGPAFGHTVSALLIWRFPLDEDAHAQVRRELDAREGTPTPAPALSTATERSQSALQHTCSLTPQPTA